VHEEVCKLDQDFGATFSGMLTDGAGKMRALWGSYAEQVRKKVSVTYVGLAIYIYVYIGLARTIYIRCIYGIFGREITKYKYIYMYI